ncbi:MAG: radical SAM protein [Tepidisphaeraceae bacterium]
MNAIAVCSLLHELPGEGSMVRRFRGEPVLSWTMRRLALSTKITRAVVLAWDDQLESLRDLDVTARACGPRLNLPGLASVTAAQRWANGWRGGLLQTCWFDNGFIGIFVRDAIRDEQADAAVLIDPAAGLIDPGIIDDLVTTAEDGAREFYFTQAAPGLGAVLAGRRIVEQFAGTGALLGKLVHYLPDAPCLDPITNEACVPVPLEISRVADRFTLDSDRQIERLEQATVPLNGTLISTKAAGVVRRVSLTAYRPKLPRDITIELTTRRNSQPIFNLASYISITRNDMTSEQLERIIAEVSDVDDARITLAGVGDPLLHPQAIEFISRLTKVAAVAVETDLIDTSADTLINLAHTGLDVVAVHLPATSPAIYQRVMGVDRLANVLENIRLLLDARRNRVAGVPIVAPVFTKLLANFDEMETWYDTWLRAVGSAVINGPSSFGGRLTGVEVADMTPPIRRECQGIRDRIVVLSDGTIVACEQDLTAENPLGKIDQTSLASVWAGPMKRLAEEHAALNELPTICRQCKEWHRP